MAVVAIPLCFTPKDGRPSRKPIGVPQLPVQSRWHGFNFQLL